jgi:hypothetical protein
VDKDFPSALARGQAVKPLEARRNYLRKLVELHFSYLFKTENVLI